MVTDNLVKKGWFTPTFRLQICSQLIILLSQREMLDSFSDQDPSIFLTEIHVVEKIEIEQLIVS